MMRWGKSCLRFSHTARPSPTSLSGNASDLTPLGRGVIANDESVRSIVVNSKSMTLEPFTYRVIPISKLSAASLYCSSIVAPFDAAPVQQPVMKETADSGGAGDLSGICSALIEVASAAAIRVE